MKQKWSKVLQRSVASLKEKSNLKLLLVGAVFVALGFGIRDVAYFVFLNLTSPISISGASIGTALLPVYLSLTLNFLLLTWWKSLLVSSTSGRSLREAAKDVGVKKYGEIMAAIALVCLALFALTAPFMVSNRKTVEEPVGDMWNSDHMIPEKASLISLPLMIAENGAKIGLPLILFNYTLIQGFLPFSAVLFLVSFLLIFLFQPVIIENRGPINALRSSLGTVINNPLSVALLWALASMIFYSLNFLSLKLYELVPIRQVVSIGPVLSIYIIFVLETHFYIEFEKQKSLEIFESL